MKATLAVLTISLMHFGLSVAAAVLNFRMTMDRLDVGAAPTLFEQGLVVAQEILFFPVVTLCLRVPLVEQFVSGMNSTQFLEWIPFIVNSVLWGLVLAWVTAWPFRCRSGLSCDKAASDEFLSE